MKGKKTEEAVSEKKVKSAKKPEAPVEQETVIEEVVSTVPEDYTYTVALEAKKIPGRNPDQVEALVFGAMGAMKKITVIRG